MTGCMTGMTGWLMLGRVHICKIIFLNMYMSRRLYNLVGNSRVGDIKSGRYDKQNHITSKYLKELKLECGQRCSYCECELDWSHQPTHIRRPKQVTLQRVNNKLGHIKGNCVYACFECNVVKRIECRENLLSRFDTDRLYNFQEIRAILYEKHLTHME
jgi:hypothetical protein